MATQETAMKTNSFRFKRFWREVKAELRKVSWPDKKELSAYTGVVFISVLVVAVVIWAIDSVFTAALKAFIE